MRWFLGQILPPLQQKVWKGKKDIDNEDVLHIYQVTESKFENFT